MGKLKGYQRTFLRGSAHKLKPVVFIGQNGLSPAVMKAIDDSLNQHELIKIKFLDFKEKEAKEKLAADIEKETGSGMVGMIGHTAIFFRMQRDPEKRKIIVPQK